MTEDNREQTNKLEMQPAGPEAAAEFGAAGKSLSDALRISFAILKIIMIILVVVFLASGFRMIGSDEQALVLRFGKIRGIAEDRILGPGLHWVFPYPIDEIIKIPVAKRPNLPINSFWYHLTKEDTLPTGPRGKPRVPRSLDPIRDGYCITRGEGRSRSISGVAGGDYHIVHCKWQLTYGIDDPERFFENVYVRDTKPGEIYFDVISESLEPLLENLISDAVVTTMVNYNIDQALLGQDRIPRDVRKLLQDKLDKIESGITVYSVQLTDITWPRQVDEAFLASIKISQISQKDISDAKGYAENTLNEAAGPVAAELLAMLHGENVSDDYEEMLWSQLAGQAQEKIAQARAYRTEIVETAKANAEYLKNILPEYRKRPKLVLQEIYQDAVEYVLENTDEKMIIQPTYGAKGREIRILLNRDPAIKPKSEQKEDTDEHGHK